MTRRSSAAALAVLALLAPGCGTGKAPPPDTTTPAAPQGSTQRSFPSSGVAFTAPANWSVDPGDGGEVATIASAAAAVGVFRYARVEELPSSRSELDDATNALVEAAKVRDPTYRETARRITRIDGLRAVEVRGVGTVLGRVKTIRSLHVYGRRGEVVVDALASAADFARLDASVFTPLVDSLQITRAQS